MKTGDEIPSWFSYPEVVKILRETNPPRSKQGFAILIDNSHKLGDYLSFALQSTLNQFLGERRITKLNADQANDSFIVGELVKAGSGLLFQQQTQLQLLMLWVMVIHWWSTKRIITIKLLVMLMVNSICQMMIWLL